MLELLVEGVMANSNVPEVDLGEHPDPYLGGGEDW